jgi:choice-of-anchor B domain-containing protein
MKKSYFLFIFSFIFFNSFGQQNNLELLYQWSDETGISGDNWVGNIYNEIWGFVQNDHEFAVIGTTQGTHIFDVTEPVNSYLVASIDGGSTSPDVVHRDFDDYNGYLYAVADEMNSSTLQIMDLSNLPNSINVVYDSNDIITRAHNIFIDKDAGLMYVCGGKVYGNNNYLCIISLENPENPTFITDFNTHGYVHDIYVENNIGYLNCGNNGLHIVDFSDLNNPETLGSLTDYPYQGYNHSGWLTEDGNTYVFADENHGYKMKICDISNPSEINITTTLLSDVYENSIPHNLIIKNNLLYVSHYYDGLWIWDISNPENPTYVASYDTYPGNNGTSYKGAWGVYPLLPSGIILVSDMQSGLFIFELEESSSNIREEMRGNIFPNPFDHHINIKSVSSNQKTINIYDVFGKKIISKQTTEKDIRLTLSELSKGIYIVQMHSETETFEKRIIKY